MQKKKLTIMAVAAVVAFAFTSCKDDDNSVRVQSLQLSQQSMTIEKGETGYLSASIKPNEATNQKIFWTSENSEVVELASTGWNYNTVESDAGQAALRALSKGTTYIVAQSEDGRYTDTCRVSVVVTLRSLTPGKYNPTPDRGTSQTLSVEFNPADASNKELTWYSSNSNVVSVTDQGVATVVGPGRAIVYASGYGANGSRVLAQFDFEIPYIKVSSISLSRTEVELEQGDTLRLNAVVFPFNADDKRVAWTTSSSYYATVTNDGLVKAVNPGNATIYVTAADGSAVRAYCSVRVYTNPVKGVSLSQSEASLYKGQTLTLNPSFTPSNATNKNVSWTSSNTKVATVNNGVVTAVAPGTATITVRTSDGGYTAQCVVTVLSTTDINYQPYGDPIRY